MGPTVAILWGAIYALLLIEQRVLHQRLMPTESAQQALSILRDPSNFQWYVIPFLLIVIYIDHDQIGRGNWSVVFAGLALWGMDWFNKIWNALNSAPCSTGSKKLLGELAPYGS